MNRTSIWCWLLAGVVAAAACATGSDPVGLGDGDGDEDESGGAGTGGAGTGDATAASTGGATVGSTASSSGTASSSTAASSSSMSSSSGSGGGVCDNTGDCALCQDCALNPPGACSDVWTTCNANPQCTGLNTCLNGCGVNDQVCIDNCVLLYPNGANDLVAAGECIFCTECYFDCDGASQSNCP